MRSILSTAGLAIWFGLAFWPATAQISFTRHAVATIGQPLDVTTGDINGDGHTDLATVSTADGEVAWWANNGQGSFVKKQIKTGFSGGRSIRSGDIDGDGDTDLIAASYTGNRIEWYENDGSETFTTRLLDGNFRGAHTVQLTDLDLDWDIDILCSGWDNSAAPSEVAWWENIGGGFFTKHVVTASMDQSPFVEAADVDLDGDLDLIGSDETTGEVYWWSNNGSQDFTQHLIDNQLPLAHTVLARDIDKDGDPDILAAATSSSLLAWYENKRAGIFEKHAMENLGGAIWLDMADFDSDGDQDMVATGMAATQLVLFTNNGKQVFTRTMIPGSLTSGFALNLTDLDRDGDTDVVAIGYSSNFLGWWENTSDRNALIQSPSWITPGPAAGSFFVVNNDRGNIISTPETGPGRGVAYPGYCQGIVLINNFLYANTGSSLSVYHPETGVRITSYRTDAQFLQGIAATPAGMICLSAPMDGKILGFNPADGQFLTLAEGLDYPGALRYDPLTGEILVLDGEAEITVKSLNPANGSISLKQATGIMAGGDIETDGAGNCYISSPSENLIYVNTSAWTLPSQVYRGDLEGPWGMWFDGVPGELVVAMNGSGHLERIPATATGIAVSGGDPDSLIKAWPNPFTNRISIRIPGGYRPASDLKMVTLQGKVVWRYSSVSGALPPTGVEIDLTGRDLLPAGLYCLVYTDQDRTVSLPLIHLR